MLLMLTDKDNPAFGGSMKRLNIIIATVFIGVALMVAATNATSSPLGRGSQMKANVSPAQAYAPALATSTISLVQQSATLTSSTRPFRLIFSSTTRSGDQITVTIMARSASGGGPLPVISGQGAT